MTLSSANPEILLLKSKYRLPIRTILANVLSRLSSRDRVLLRLYYLESMSIDRLGKMYGVNRATAARWIAAIRDSLMSEVRAEVRKTCRLTRSECDDVMAIVRSDVDLSLTRHLAADIDG